MREHFVIDPLISKRQQLLLATQLCRMVLKVRSYLRSLFVHVIVFTLPHPLHRDNIRPAFVMPRCATPLCNCKPELASGVDHVLSQPHCVNPFPCAPPQTSNAIFCASHYFHFPTLLCSAFLSFHITLPHHFASQNGCHLVTLSHLGCRSSAPHRSRTPWRVAFTSNSITRCATL
jgi:hypothetical protein